MSSRANRSLQRAQRFSSLEGRSRMNVTSWVSSCGLVIAMACGVFALGWGTFGRAPAPQKDEYHLEGPFTQGNLSVFLVHGTDKIKGQTFITLQEALVQKKVIVRETREVNELSIENISSQEVYVQSGDIVKGGNQDRMMAVDLILPAHSGKIPIAAFCVENGRWS